MKTKLRSQTSMRKGSIVYLNYHPYENSGHILEYLLDTFEKVFLISISFHTLGNKSVNRVVIYRNGKLIKEEFMFCITVPKNLVFIFLPLRSSLNAIQIVKKIISLKNEYGPIGVYFTINAFTATIGRVLEKFNVVDKTVFWVWDFYPINHPSVLARVMRRLYWQFEKLATNSDRVVYLHRRLFDARKKKGLLKNKKCVVVPIGTGKILPVRKKNFENPKIGFIGVLKSSQGIGMMLDSASVLAKHFNRLTFEIIGSGPDDDIFLKRIPKSSRIKYNFYGLVSERKFKEVLYNCTIGISPYAPEKGTVSKYTDPGKPKRYIEFNLPVITTNVIEISKEIKGSGAGEIIKYGDSEDLAKAIKKIINNYDSYVKNVIEMHKKYYYKSIYPAIFEFRKD